MSQINSQNKYSEFFRLVEDRKNGRRVDERGAKEKIIQLVANVLVHVGHSRSGNSKVL